MVRKGGLVNFFGGPPSGTKVQLDTNRLHYGDITLKASFHHTPATCRTAFELSHQRTLQVRRLHHRPRILEQVPELFARMMTRNAVPRHQDGSLSRRGAAVSEMTFSQHALSALPTST